MSAPNTSVYYHRNIPKGKFGKDVDAGDWDGAAPVTVTIQPGTSQSLQVKKIVLRVADLFAMSAGDSIVITMDAYDSATHYQRTVSQATPLLDIIRLGDPDKYQAKVIGGVNYHIVVIPFEPPAYLRSSETPSESLAFVYNDVGGGVTAGKLLIDVDYWETAEDDSGLE